MSAELWVDSVSVERWGRASGMAVSLGTRAEAGGFIVIYGPNESGKTSLATALAWMIAGPGTQGVLWNFGEPEEVLKAGFRGRLSSDPLRVNVQVKVTGQPPGSSAAKQEEFEASRSDAVLSRAEFLQQIAVGDFAGYRSLHWVEALEVAEGEGMTERLSVKAMFGGISPDEEAEKLEGAGQERIGKSNRKSGTAWALLAKDEDRRAQIIKLGSEWQRLAELEEALKQTVSRLDAAQESRTELSAKHSSVQIALAVVEAGLLEKRDQASEALARAVEPSTEEQRILTHSPQLSNAASRLATAEEELRRGKEESLSAEERVPSDWRGLISESPIGKSELAKARQASANLTARRENAERAGDALASAKEDYLELIKRLQLQEDEWHEVAPEEGLSPQECTPQAAEKLLQQSKRQRFGVLTAGALGLVVAVVEAAIGGGSRAWGIAAGLIVVGASLALAAWWRKGWRRARSVAELTQSEQTHTILNLRQELGDAQNTEAQAVRGENSAKESLNKAQSGFESLLLKLGVSADLIGEDVEEPVAQLEAVAEAQQAEERLERASKKLAEACSSLNDLLGDSAVLGSAETLGSASDSSAESGVALANAEEASRFLESVHRKVAEYEELRRQAKEANDDLRVGLKGDEDAEELIGQKKLTELLADRVSLQGLLAELSEQIQALQERQVDLSGERRSLQSPDSREDLELARGELAALIEEKLVSGLGYCLASRLLSQAVEKHRRTRRPELLSHAEDLAKGVADWTSITGNPHSPERQGDLLVESSRGEHSSKRLSLGAQSLLYLALRLAAIKEQSGVRGVRLPLILDDVLVGVDDDRTEGCLGMLSEFSKEHQVIFLTCHERVAQRARSAGAKVINWPPVAAG